MKQFLHLFFLGLTVLFSFGFTSWQSGCDTKMVVMEVKHSCCANNKNHSEPQEMERESCCGTDLCEGTCCIESIDYLQFNDFVFEVNSVDVDAISSIPTYQSFLVAFNNSNITITTTQFKIPPKIRVVNPASKQIIISKQSWLI